MKNNGEQKLTEQQLIDNRNKYYELVAKAMKANQLLSQEEATIAQLFHVKDTDAIKAHYIVVSHYFAFKYGTELVIRFHAKSREVAKKLIKEHFYKMFEFMFTMQQDYKFRALETTDILNPIPFSPEPQYGGAIILEDSMLHGINYQPGQFIEDGPLYDVNYWPQHFLCLYFLHKNEYKFMQGMRQSDFIEAVQEQNQYAINDFSRISMLASPKTAKMLKRIKEKSPAKLELVGLLMDLRIRKQGKEIDIVLAPRWAMHILETLHQAFKKQVVPLETSIAAEQESGYYRAVFFCHDENGKVITPENAKFVIEDLAYFDEEGNMVEIEPNEVREYALLQPDELLKSKKLLRRVIVVFYLPPELMGNMYELVSNAVAKRDKDADWDEVPVVLEWPDKFKDTKNESGFAPSLYKNQSKQNNNGDQARFRFIVIGAAYHMGGEIAINDDGEFVKL